MHCHDQVEPDDIAKQILMEYEYDKFEMIRKLSKIKINFIAFKIQNPSVL